MSDKFNLFFTSKQTVNWYCSFILWHFVANWNVESSFNDLNHTVLQVKSASSSSKTDIHYLKRFPQASVCICIMLIVSNTSVWSYIFLLNGSDKKPKLKKQQQNKMTFIATRSQECSLTNRRQPIKLFWRVVTETLDWLASLHCLLNFLAFDWRRPAVLFFLNWAVCLFLKESPISNYPN